MPSWFSPLWDALKDPDNRTVIAFLGGGIAALAGAIWVVIKFFAEQRKKADEKKGLESLLERELAWKNDLIKSLLKNHPAAAPGVQQAVGAAVGSIAQGAAEGDSRLQKALGLLKENKITEAAQLLKAFAGDKEARAGQATHKAGKDHVYAEFALAFARDKEMRKDAAIAYRNLGAIAGLADPKRALEAYEKALALDPDDLKSLYWAGSIQIDYGDLNRAQARLERVLTLAKTDDRAFYKYWALTGLGNIKQKRGNLAGALQSYRDGLAIVARLAESDPGNILWQRDLAVAWGMVGTVQEAQRNLPAALKSYQDGLVVFERLAQSDPGNAQWQRDLSVSFNKIGGVQEAQGDLQAALKSYQDDLAITERLAQSDPGNAEWQRDLSVSYEKVGGVQEAQGDLSAALKSYSDSLAIRERLAKSDPGNAGWQRDLIVSYKKIADCSGPKERRAHLSRALEVAQALHASGRLAPADEWMLGELAKLMAEAEEK